MSVLFTPQKIGIMEIRNRFVHSATYECMAADDGQVTDALIKRYTRIAKGGTGLIIPGYLFVMPNGRAALRQTGIHDDGMIEGLKSLVDAVHGKGSRIVFQLMHSGRQTTKEVIGQTPLSPSKGVMDTIYLTRPGEMNENHIRSVIRAFGAAARRAEEAGADGVQVHAAHGYLVNQFLSPFFNKRTDSWGGSPENRFRFLKEIILEIKKNVSDDFPVMVKLNTRDFTPKEGITPDLARTYATWLADLSIDGLEVSCGTICYSMFQMCRGDVPTREMVHTFPWWKKITGKIMFKTLEGKFDLDEGYNVEAAKVIKPVIGDIPLLVVGGLRKVPHMETVIQNGWADFISMSRPFIKQPHIVNRIKEGKAHDVTCVSCNRCLAAVANLMPLQCYEKGFPK